jgi:hypothetical protein
MRFIRLASCIQRRSGITSMRIAVLLFVIVLSGLVTYIGRGIAEIVFRCFVNPVFRSVDPRYPRQCPREMHLSMDAQVSNKINVRSIPSCFMFA